MLGTEGPCRARPITLTPFTLPKSWSLIEFRVLESFLGGGVKRSMQHKLEATLLNI